MSHYKAVDEYMVSIPIPIPIEVPTPTPPTFATLLSEDARIAYVTVDILCEQPPVTLYAGLHSIMKWIAIQMLGMYIVLQTTTASWYPFVTGLCIVSYGVLDMIGFTIVLGSPPKNLVHHRDTLLKRLKHLIQLDLAALTASQTKVMEYLAAFPPEEKTPIRLAYQKLNTLIHTLKEERID